MSNKIYCPHCGGSAFKAIIKKAAGVRFNLDGSIEVLKEATNVAIHELGGCLTCQATVSQEDLVSEVFVKCNGCSGGFKKEELTDGKCPVCYAKSTREDIATASQEDLIKKILELEALAKGNSTSISPVEEKVDESPIEKVEDVVEEIPAEESVVEMPLVPEPVEEVKLNPVEVLEPTETQVLPIEDNIEFNLVEIPPVDTASNIPF